MGEPNFRRDHIPELDGLRALACLFVVWHHIGGSTVLPAGSQWVGWFGVKLFFVLSGFLITRILLHAKASGGTLRHFWSRRIKRIAPPLYLTLLACVFLWGPQLWQLWAGLYATNYTTSWVGTPMAHSWSLAVEEHFYAVWPLLVFFTPVAVSSRVALWGAVGGIAATLVAAALALRYGFAINEYQTQYQVPFLMAGATLAYLETAWRSRVGWVLGVVLMLAAFPAEHAMQLLGDHVGVAGEIHSRHTSALLLAVGMVMACVAWCPPLRWAPIRIVGQMSYGMYLYHFPLFYALRDEPWWGTVAGQCIAVGSTLLFAWLSFTFFERPILSGEWPWQRAPAPRLPAPAPASA